MPSVKIQALCNNLYEVLNICHQCPCRKAPPVNQFVHDEFVRINNTKEQRGRMLPSSVTLNDGAIFRAAAIVAD